MYVSDGIKSINDSMAYFLGGSSSTSRYVDILEQMMHEHHEDTRTAEQIITSISDKLESLNNESV